MSAKADKQLWYAKIDTENEITFIKFVIEGNRYQVIYFVCPHNRGVGQMNLYIMTPAQFEARRKEAEHDHGLISLTEFSEAINPYYQRYGEWLQEKQRLYKLL